MHGCNETLIKIPLLRQANFYDLCCPVIQLSFCETNENSFKSIETVNSIQDSLMGKHLYHPFTS